MQIMNVIIKYNFFNSFFIANWQFENLFNHNSIPPIVYLIFFFTCYVIQVKFINYYTINCTIKYVVISTYLIKNTFICCSESHLWDKLVGILCIDGTKLCLSWPFYLPKKPKLHWKGRLFRRVYSLHKRLYQPFPTAVQICWNFFEERRTDRWGCGILPVCIWE